RPYVGQSGFWKQKRARSSMVRDRPVGWGALGSGVGSQMRQALLRRSPYQCSMVPSHDQFGWQDWDVSLSKSDAVAGGSEAEPCAGARREHGLRVGRQAGARLAKL